MEFPIPRRGGLALMLGVLLVLGIAFAFYHFSHVGRQAEVLRARNLRELALLARQVEDHLASLSEVAQEAAMEDPARKTSGDEDCPDLQSSTQTFQIGSARKLSGELEWGPCLGLKTAGASSENALPWLELQSSGNEKWLSMRLLPVRDRALRLRLKLASFRKILSLPSAFFDHLLLLDSQGKVIHQDLDTQPGIRFARLDLKENLPGHSHQQQLTIAGKEYTLLAQPLIFRAPGRQLSEDCWFIAGLVSAARLRAESRVLSPTALLLLSCILALLVLSLPVLKIWVSKSHERLRRLDLLGLGAASALAMALVAILVGDLYTYRALSDASDQTLRQVARSLRNRAVSLLSEPSDPDQALSELKGQLALNELRLALPPTMGFAVLDNQGVAQIHWDPRRERYENFLTSSEGNERLVGALSKLDIWHPQAEARKQDCNEKDSTKACKESCNYEGSEEERRKCRKDCEKPSPFTVRYQGQPYRMVVTSLAQHPLWLAVFYDRKPLQRLHLDQLLWVLSAALVYVLGVLALILLLALGWYLVRGRRDSLVGSGEAFEAGDKRLVGVLGLLVATLVWTLLEPDAGTKLLAAAAIPVVALTFFMLRLIRKRGQRAAPSCEDRPLWSRLLLEWSPMLVWGGVVAALLVSFQRAPGQIQVGATRSTFVVLLCFLPLAILSCLLIEPSGKLASRRHLWLTVAVITAFIGISVLWCKLPQVWGHQLRLRLAVLGSLFLLGVGLWRRQPIEASTRLVETSRPTWLARGGGVLLNALLVLLVVVALPTGLLFQAIWQAEHWTWVALGQRHLAASLDHEGLDSLCPSEDVDNSGNQDTRSKDIRDVLATLFSTQVVCKPEHSEDSSTRLTDIAYPSPQPLEKADLYETLLPIWSLLERLHRHLPLDKHRQLGEGSDSTQSADELRWTEHWMPTHKNNVLRLGFDDDSHSKRAEALVSNVTPPRNGKLLGPSLAGLGGLVCLFFIGWSARKLLVVDFGSGPTSLELPDKDDHLLWIGDRESLQKVFPDNHRCQWIDLEDPALRKRLKAGKLQASEEVARVVLPGFEKLREDPATMASLFQQLAGWVDRDDLTIVLASSELVPPHEILAAFQGPEAEDSASPGDAKSSKDQPVPGAGTTRPEILEMLASFTLYDRGELEPPESVGSEPSYTDGLRKHRAWGWLLEEAGENPRLLQAASWLMKSPKLRDMRRRKLEQTFETAVCFYYRWLWSRCSEEEKRVLFQLAEEGMINPAAGEIGRRLLRKGLATLPPHRGLRPMNETFRRWVRTTGQREKLREEENQLAARQGGWPEVRNPILLALALLSIFLLTTQQQLVGPTLGQVQQSFGQMATLFTALAGGIAGLAQLVWRATSSGS